MDVYVDLLRNPAALHAVFEYYRTLDEWPEQVQRWRDEGPLSIPVLDIGGEYATGTGPEEVMRLLATSPDWSYPGSVTSWPKRLRTL
ncbi:hypothetical protein ABZW44_35740 [Streptomyces mirabilis]|uniref:hypothetical protein n=1 Tax=Streptomyces mirabilis TaxID=68239 RepID=UPI0033B3D59F